MDPIAIGTDGGSLSDCRPLNYAWDLLREHGLPVVIKPCTVDGEDELYVTAYEEVNREGANLLALAEDADITKRAAVSVGMLVRATAEAHELETDPDHPTRRGEP